MSEPRTIVITGGTKGLGNAAAKAFLTHGDRVWILSRNKPSTEDSHPNLKHHRRLSVYLLKQVIYNYLL